MDLNAQSLCITIDQHTIVDEVTLTAKGGEFIGIIGPNGAGKSTLLRALAGLVAPHRGRVFLKSAPQSPDALSLHAMNRTARARHIAYLAQQREAYWDMPAEAIVALGRYAYGQTARNGPDDQHAITAALAATGMAAFRTRSMSTLSGGEAARIHLARALAGETPILIADEPAANLDPAQALRMMRLLRQRAEEGGLVITAMHDLGLAQRFCSRLVILSGGQCVGDGPPHEALTGERLHSVFDLEADDCAALGIAHP